MDKHTPGPWTVGQYPGAERRQILAQSGQISVCRALEEDAKFIVHAANAYPKLVEALRDLIAVDDSAADTDHAGRFGGALDPARALLRELGEAE